MAREVVAGLVGGAIGAGLMKLAIPKIEARKQIIHSQSIQPGSTILLQSTAFKFAVVLFHGDGNPEVRLDITVNGNTTSIKGNEQAIELLANETISIVAVNEATEPKTAPKIEILSLTF